MNKKILFACGAILLLFLFIGCTGPAPPGPYPDDSNWTAEQKECMGNCDASPQECWFICYAGCGDGECSEKELDTKSCPKDCSEIITPKDAICGDGICQELVVAGPYGEGFPDRYGCSVDCWKFLDPDPCGTTIPLSPVINSVNLDFDAPLTIPSFGDFWRNTWATDNKLYTAWGDGEGFIEGRDFHVMGTSAISGTYPNLEGENRFVSEHLYPESKINEKPGSLLAINDRLYLTGESNDHEGTFFIAYSDDQGVTWTKSPGTWDLEGINGLHPNFINMGKNFEFGGDYVYTIISNDQSVNQVYLSRVLKKSILDYNEYKFYSGNDTWSSSSFDAVRILPDNVIEPTEIHLTANYHPGVDRYLMITTQNVFDAPSPWGPWTCAGTWLTEESPAAWQGGYYPSIIAKDLEGGNYQADYLYFAIAGQNKNSVRLGYSFNIGKITMELNNTSELWGRIANAGNKGTKIATTLYFPGIPIDESHYTANPLPDEKEFSEEEINIQLDRMKSIGINSVQISYWGRNFSEGTMAYQMNADNDCIVDNICTRTRAMDGNISIAYTRLINQIEQKDLMFFPLLEVSNTFNFGFNFPDNLDNMTERISWFVENYGNSPAWTQIYDKTGEPRKLISLIGTFRVSTATPQEFSDGFEEVANRIYDKHGIRIGFSIDPGVFSNSTPTTPLGTGGELPDPDELRDNKYILSVLPWEPTGGRCTDIKKDKPNLDDNARFEFAQDCLTYWNDNEYPVVSFVMPGYDSTRVFGPEATYGIGLAWREQQKELAIPSISTAGISIGPWNGWTEYYHTTCSIEEGATNLKWAKEVIDISNGRLQDSSEITCPSSKK